MSEILSREEWELLEASDAHEARRYSCTIEALAEALKRYDHDDSFEPPRYSDDVKRVRDKGWLD